MNFKKMICVVSTVLMVLTMLLMATACKNTVSTTVTAEQWKAAFGSEKFQDVRILASIKYTGGEQSALEYIAADGKEYYTQTDGDAESSFEGALYSQKRENGYRIYEQQKDREWRIFDSETSVFEKMGFSLIITEVDYYDLFTYDELKQCYTNIVETTDTVTVNSVFFVDGELSEIDIDLVYKNNESIIYSIYTIVFVFGGQNITLPDLREE